MNRALLVLNAGSSSLKYSVFADEEPPRLLMHGNVDGLGTAEAKLDHAGATARVLSSIAEALGEAEVAAVGHRVVHGGSRFSAPALVDDAALAEMDALVPLAPLHQPHNLAAIRAVSRALPSVPQVACFDTAFHATQPAVARAFALPRRYAEEGVRRYGFHGLSYEYIASVLPSIDARAASGRTIVLHLGNGASMCALAGSKSVATTMSFTALDGLVMGTRCGSIDPGVLLYLMQHDGLDVRALEELLYERSGLLGVSGESSDMRALLASTSPAAAEAVDLFVYRIVRELGSLCAALGGLDALVFTGGIGENAAIIRARVCQGASFFGVDLDEDANGRGGPRITREESHVSAWVIPTNEELMIARHTRAVLAR